MTAIPSSVIPLLAGTALLLVGNGLQFTLLPLRGAEEQFGALMLGMIASAYFVGFVGGCQWAPRLVRNVGHIRVFTAAVAVAAAVSVAYALVPVAIAWVGLRLVAGFCLAAFYLVIESWLNDSVDNGARGRVMSAYIGVSFGAVTLGQMLVPLYPITEAGGFMLAGVLAALAIVPVALTPSAQPARIAIVRLQPGALYRAAPVALVASFMIGVANGAFWGLAPLSTGLDVAGVAWFMTLAVLAGAVVQWPLGRLSDRFDRRLVLLPTLIAAAAVGVALWALPVSDPQLLALGCLFGAFTLPGYSLAAAHGYDKTSTGDMVSIAATILLVNALGSVIGPLIASPMMASLGPRSLFLFTAVVQVMLAGFVLYRTRVSQAPVAKTAFDLATTAPVVTAVGYEMVEEAAPAQQEEPQPGSGIEAARRAA